MNEELLELTSRIVSAYVAHNSLPMAELPALIAQVSASLQAITELSKPRQNLPPVPAVNPKRSVFPDYLISLEDGKRFKSLKRNLATSYGMTPEQYRTKWDLPVDYPMTAPNYSATRSALAKAAGLGVKGSHPTKGRGRSKKG